MTHTDEQKGSYPSHIMGGNTMAVTDVKNRDTAGFSKQKIPNLAHTGE